MANTLLLHGIVAEGNVGQGVGISKAIPSHVGPSHKEDPLGFPEPTRSIDHTGHAEGSKHCVMPHPCTPCGNIFYGTYSEFQSDGLLQYAIQTRSSHSLLFFVSQFFIVS